MTYSRMIRIAVGFLMAIMFVLSPISTAQNAAAKKFSMHSSSSIAISVSADCPSHEPPCMVDVDQQSSATDDEDVSGASSIGWSIKSGLWCAEYCVSAVIDDAPDQSVLYDGGSEFPSAVVLATGEHAVPFRPPTTA